MARLKLSCVKKSFIKTYRKHNVIVLVSRSNFSEIFRKKLKEIKPISVPTYKYDEYFVGINRYIHPYIFYICLKPDHPLYGKNLINAEITIMAGELRTYKIFTQEYDHINDFWVYSTTSKLYNDGILNIFVSKLSYYETQMRFKQRKIMKKPLQLSDFYIKL